MRVARADGPADGFVDGFVVGEWPSAPESVALVEAAGAVLAWDVLTADPLPAARIDDPARAGEWLWEIYGSSAEEILGGADEVTVPAEGDWSVRAACRRLAQLNWVRAWWPASASAGVPALDPVVLQAERAVATSVVEHLLDDPDAVTRELASVQVPDLEPLATQVTALAEDYGVALAAAAPARAEYALAAGTGGSSAGTTVLTGSSSVDWTLVPAGVVDAAAPADWAVVRRQGATVVEVSVAMGPQPGPPLAARFADIDVPLSEVDALGRITGSAPVPPSVLLLPPDRRAVTVYAPDFAAPSAPAPGADERRAALIAYARSRAGAPDATLTERTAR